MSSSHNFLRWLRGATAAAKPEETPARGPRTTRRCVGLAEFMRDLRGSEDQKPCALDLGPTSPANITFLADRHLRVYNENILRGAMDPAIRTNRDDGTDGLDLEKFFASNLAYQDRHFDAILCWDAADYLPEELVKPVVEKLHRMLKPKGTLLAFFHTRDAGAESPYCRYHIVQPDTIELEPAAGFRLQRIFNNRHLENLFKDFSSRRFFLGRDNIREVILVR